MTKSVNVRRCVSYDALVKLVQDVVKVDAARYNLQLCSLAITISGTAHPRIENDNDIYMSVENEVTDNIDDNSIPNVDRGSHDDED
ncbi:hypothetical protein Ddye_009473 [Dipteronia dyeriana]|uniref:Uncharacterized protein n=1 Tax=Dipteronia dyeriana TaxID=168575 RepID=A0AAD9XC27_9ROSI|nr:hypothetical protein Ddye_009473 [Dipteronia dyeriana]